MVGPRGGSELSSSSKVRDFAPDFQSSKKFEVREQVHEPKNLSFFKLFLKNHAFKRIVASTIQIYVLVSNFFCKKSGVFFCKKCRKSLS